MTNEVCTRNIYCWRVDRCYPQRFVVARSRKGGRCRVHGESSDVAGVTYQQQRSKEERCRMATLHDIVQSQRDEGWSSAYWI